VPRKTTKRANGRPLALVQLEGIVDAEFRRGKRWDMQGKASAGAVELVSGLFEEGYEVLVAAKFVRPGSEGRRDATRLEAWLAKNGFPPVRAVSRKSPPRAALDMGELLRRGVVKINFVGFYLELARRS